MAGPRRSTAQGKLEGESRKTGVGTSAAGSAHLGRSRWPSAREDRHSGTPAGKGRLPAATLSPLWGSPGKSLGRARQRRASPPGTRGAEPHLGLQDAPARTRAGCPAACRALTQSWLRGTFQRPAAAQGREVAVHSRVAHPAPDSTSACRVPAPAPRDTRRPAGAGPGPDSALSPEATLRPTPPPSPRGALRPSFLPQESERREEKVWASRPHRTRDRSSAPATAGQPHTSGPGVSRRPAGPSPLTKGRGAAPNARSPTMQKPPLRGPQAALRPPSLSAAAAAASPSSSLATSAAHPARELLSLGRGWVSAERAPVTWRGKEERRCRAPAGGAPGPALRDPGSALGANFPGARCALCSSPAAAALSVSQVPFPARARPEIPGPETE